MTDQRFEDWWVRNPARVVLSPAAKEVARGVWQAARDDLVAEASRSRYSIAELASAHLAARVAVHPNSVLARLCVVDTEDDDTIPLAQPRCPCKVPPC